MSSIFSRFFGAGFLGAAAGFGAMGLRRGVTTAARCSEPGQRPGIEIDEEGHGHDLIDEDTLNTLKRAGAQVTMPWHAQGNGISLRYKPFRIIESIEVAPDTKLIRCAPKNPEDFTFHLAPAATLQVRHGVNGSCSPADQLERQYTPVSPSGVKGHFDIVVRKLPNGRMSNSLCDAPIGTEIHARAQLFKLKYKANRWENIGMVSGGTGITPMLQIIRAALPLAGPGADSFCAHLSTPQHRLKCEFSDGEVLAAAQKQQAIDKTKLSLLYLNRNEDHIMFKSYLDELAERFPERFRVAYAVDKPKDEKTWKGFKGYISKEMMGATMPSLSGEGNNKNLILVCGPDGLVSAVTGCPMNLLKAMHSGSGRLGARRVQPLGAHIHSQTWIGGLIAEMNGGEQNVDPAHVYKF